MKHDHKKTKKLKVALFAMIMFLPFIAIGVTCATHIFNEKVTEQTQTAEIKYKFEVGKPIQNGILEPYTLYEMLPNYAERVIEIQPYYFLAVYNNEIYFYTEANNINSFWSYDVESAPIVARTYDDYVAYIYGNDYQLPNNILGLEFHFYIAYIEQQQFEGIYADMFAQSPNNCPNVIKSVNITTNPQDQTTNIFYDSCDQVQDSFVLNWCTNGNPIRNGINAFTNAFNLPNDHMINTLLTYWLCISMIYIVIDIIIECIVYITHFFNKEV